MTSQALKTTSENETKLAQDKNALVERATALVIESVEDCEKAVEFAKQLQAQAKKIEEERVILTKPINDAVKNINTRFKLYTAPLETAAAAVRSKILAFQQHQAAIEREKQEALRREAEIEEENRRAAMVTEADIAEPQNSNSSLAGLGEALQDMKIGSTIGSAPASIAAAPAPVSVVPARVRSDSGALATVKKITRYRVTDIAALAAAHPACVVVNNAAVMALVNGGVSPIAGIEVYVEDQLQIR